MKLIKRNHKKIYEEMLKIDSISGNFIIDFFISIYNVSQLKEDTKGILIIGINENNYYQSIAALGNIVIYKKNNWEKILDKAISRNKQYIEYFGYHTLSEEKIKKVFDLEMVPSMHNRGIVPDMLIMYCFGNNIFQGEKLEFYKKCQKEKLEKNENKNPEIPNLKASVSQKFENSELDLYSDEEYIKDINRIDWEGLAKKFGYKYDDETKTYSNVKRSFILLLHLKIEEFERFREAILTEIDVTTSITHKVNLFATQQGRLVKELFALRDENKSLKVKIKKLLKEFKDMEKSVQIMKNKTQSDKDQSDKDKQILELNKKNNFLQARIEKLENQISLLEESKQINETIQENIEIQEKVLDITKQTFEFQEICILGGDWNSKEKEKLQEALPTCDIEFIEAERTLAKIDRIANADIVIFDTSKNAHAYYYKVKQFAKKVLHINKSKAEAVKGLETNNDLQN